MDKQTIERLSLLMNRRSMVEYNLSCLRTHFVFQIPEMYQNIIDRDKLYQIQKEANDTVKVELKAKLEQIDKEIEAL